MRFAGNKILVLLASVLPGTNAFRALELGIDVLESNGHALLKNKRVELNRQLRTNLMTRGSRGEPEMFFKCCGSSSLAQFARGRGSAGIVPAWTEVVNRFKGERGQYLLY
jgi:hypothetical protein